eukprot:1442436-Pleurochrysis_carterae.AAC.2
MQKGLGQVGVTQQQVRSGKYGGRVCFCQGIIPLRSVCNGNVCDGNAGDGNVGDRNVCDGNV